MKKTLLVVVVTALFAVGASAGTLPSSLIRPHGHTQSLSFDDLGLGGGGASAGTYNGRRPVTFSFDVNLTFAGYNGAGLSYWLEVNAALAPFITVTATTYGTAFPDPTQPNPTTVAFNASAGASVGFLTETRDFGATINDFNNPPAPGTYFCNHITFSIAANAPLGSYILQSTVVNPHTSESTSFDGTNFADENLPASQYMLTIVPEPTTLALIGLTAVGGAIIAHRRRVLRG